MPPFSTVVVSLVWLHLSCLFSRRPVLCMGCASGSFTCFDLCLFWHGGVRKREFSVRKRLWREGQIQKSLKVVSEGSGASLKKGEARGEGGGCWESKVELKDCGTHSLLRKVRSDGEASRPERGQAEDRLDGGPGATEDGLPLSVVQLHKGILGNRQEEKQKVRQLIGLSGNMCLPMFAFLHQLLIWWV